MLVLDRDECFSAAVKVVVYVTPKKNVLDPQGAAVGHALQNLGMTDLRSVRVGKTIEIEVDGEPGPEFSKSVDRYCHELLSNPVIEDYRWEMVPS